MTKANAAELEAANPQRRQVAHQTTHSHDEKVCIRTAQYLAVKSAFITFLHIAFLGGLS